MDFQDHFLFSIAIGQLFLRHSSFIVLVLFYFISFTFSSFPDIDLYLEKRIKGIKSFKHRYLFHSIIFYVGIYLLLYSFNTIYLNLIFIVILSHIFLDIFGKKGVNLFYPLVDHFYRIKLPFLVVRILVILFFIFSSTYFYGSYHNLF